MQAQIETTTRQIVIAKIREALRKRAGDDRSICRLAAEENIFCTGFRRFCDSELRRRLQWISRKRPAVDRAEFEDLADRWQLARQEHDCLTTSCDVQRAEHDLCNGWDDFTTEELQEFYVAIAAHSGRPS